MKYMGSKNRIAKHIVPIMTHQRSNQQWVEPFVGGGNIIDKIKGRRIGCDADKNTIQALVDIRDNVQLLPKNNSEFTEEDYRALKGGQFRFSSYAGFAFSYSGKWMGGWRRDKERKRDYVNEAWRNALNQSPLLQGVDLVCCKYNEIKLHEKSIIYCDPPYSNTTKYATKFNHNDFFDWCRAMSDEGHCVFVSEYSAPEDFACIWEKEIVSSLTKDTGSKTGVERLFKLRGCRR